jgi:hypothetical protein
MITASAIERITRNIQDAIKEIEQAQRDDQALRDAARELVQSVEFILKKHGHQLTGILKLSTDLRRVKSLL